MARSRVSITLRLTLFFALASSVVLLALGYLIARAVERHFVELDMTILSEKLDQTQTILFKAKLGEPSQVLPENSLVAIAQQLDDSLVGQTGLAVAVRAPNGQFLFATNGAEFPQALFDRSVPGDASKPMNWTSPRGIPFRGIAARIDTAPGQSSLVAVATDITHHEHFMRSFRLTLWTFVVLAALLTGFLGWLAVRRGLSPLQAMREEAEGITAQKLDARVSVDAVPVELLALAETLNAMLSRLEDSFRRLSDFSSDLAHELRTPVSNLLTQTQVTLSRPRTAVEYADVLASNVEEFERLSGMIADMLFIAKADDGRLVPTPESMWLAPVAEEVIEYYRLLADEKSVSIRCFGDAPMTGDRPMIRRAIANLLSNAIRHCSVGSTIVVAIEPVVGGRRIVVTNDGKTIPAEHQARLFDRFYRADPSRQREGSHSGLGLAIVKSIVLAHGGQVAVQSAVGKTSFSLDLPDISHSSQKNS